jgi:hypothetical protein
VTKVTKLPKIENLLIMQFFLITLVTLAILGTAFDLA